jgi:hypothetical protein
MAPEAPPARPLPELLLGHLPEPPARVLLLSPDPALAAALAAAGHEVTAEPPSVPGSPGGRESAPFDAAVLLPAPGAEPPDLLPSLRRRLAEGGRLLIAAEPSGEAARRRTRGLYESAFAVLAEEPAAGRSGGALLTVARAARHRVRPYRDGDEAAILELFARAFHQPRSLERWRWEYAENPHGNHRISLAVDRDDRIGAHYAGYPVRFWNEVGLGGRGPGPLECLHVGDTMTAPEARGVGRGATALLTRAVRHFYATWCDGRVAFNFGANTGKIQRFSRRTAGARRLGPVPFRTRPLPGARFGAPGPLGARLGGWRVERESGFDRRFDELWERCRGAYRLLVERDRRYLAWRYAAPDVEYFVWTVSRRGRLAGWSVFRQEGERLIWGDALFDPREERAPAALLARVAAAPEHRAARRIEGWLTERPGWWGRRVAELGFVAEPEPEDLGLVYVPFEVDPGEAFAEHLYYTKGDVDLF